MPDPAPQPTLRPRLGDAEAELFRPDEVLRHTGTAGAETVEPWFPLGADGRRAAGAGLRLRVDPAAADGKRCLDTILGAVNRAVRLAEEGAPAIHIDIVPGRYPELVYLPRILRNGRDIPITLAGCDGDPRGTVIEADIDQGLTGAAFDARFGAAFAGVHPAIAAIFHRIAARDTLGTANASVLRVENTGFRMENLTVRNLYHHRRLAEFPGGDMVAAGVPQLASGNHQAVAMMINGADRVHLRNVHLLAYQDTLYFRASEPFSTVRACFEGCVIEGDVDFIFGPSTAFFHGCEIRSLGTRTAHSYVAAPSTNIRTRYGIVFDDCDFTHDGSANARAGTFNLARQWFEGVRATPYGRSPVPGYRCTLSDVSAYEEPVGTISRQTLEAVGKVVVLNSRIGAHINCAAPWADWNGGTYARDGSFAPGVWSPRYRPFQIRAADFLNRLAPWLAAQRLDYSDIDPSLRFLGEYRNRTDG